MAARPFSSIRFWPNISFWFLSAIGGLPASAIAEWLGAPITVALGALSVSGFGVLLFILSSELRELSLEPAQAPATIAP